MTAHRTVFWLALLTAIVPFLAIPETLMQFVVVVLAVAIMITARMSNAGSRSQSFDSPHTNGDDDSGNDNTHEETDHLPGLDFDSEDTSKEDGQDNPVDVTDPNADRMVASGQWRRRSSRDIGGDNS